MTHILTCKKLSVLHKCTLWCMDLSYHLMQPIGQWSLMLSSDQPTLKHIKKTNWLQQKGNLMIEHNLQLTKFLDIQQANKMPLSPQLASTADVTSPNTLVLSITSHAVQAPICSHPAVTQLQTQGCIHCKHIVHIWCKYIGHCPQQNHHALNNMSTNTPAITHTIHTLACSNQQNIAMILLPSHSKHCPKCSVMSDASLLATEEITNTMIWQPYNCQILYNYHSLFNQIYQHGYLTADHWPTNSPTNMNHIDQSNLQQSATAMGPPLKTVSNPSNLWHLSLISIPY